jgi:hypothetical protein
MESTRCREASINLSLFDRLMHKRLPAASHNVQWFKSEKLVLFSEIPVRV